MARRVQYRKVDLVRDMTEAYWLQHANNVTEDPSEFFTMIFGGEAFVDW
jgi:hypothetical protein